MGSWLATTDPTDSFRRLGWSETEALAEAREEKLRAVMTLQRMAAPILAKRAKSRRLWIFSTPA